jgi:hypothetical protein
MAQCGGKDGQIISDNFVGDRSYNGNPDIHNLLTHAENYFPSTINFYIAIEIEI